MAKSMWMISSQMIDGKRQYIAYRLKNILQVDHAGNRETYGNYSPDRGAVDELVKQLNEGAIQP